MSLPVFTSIAARSCDALLLTNEGLVYHFGDDLLRSVRPKKVASKYTPYIVPGLTNIVSVAVSNEALFAVDSNGLVFASGTDLGYAVDGTSEIQKCPNIVHLQTLHNIKSITAGNGYFFALHTDGKVSGWGSNSCHVLGIGSIEKSAPPTTIPTLQNIVSISTGDRTTIALDSSGNVYTWGSGNNNNRLGHKSSNHVSVPCQVQGIENVIEAHCDDNHFLCLTADGSVYEWGYFKSKENGSKKTVSVPTKIQELPPVKKLFVGSSGAFFALSQAGDLWGFGSNDENVFLLAHKQSFVDPHIVSFSGQHNFVSIIPRRDCCLALDEAGNLLYWGSSSWFRLPSSSSSSVVAHCTTFDSHSQPCPFSGQIGHVDLSTFLYTVPDAPLFTNPFAHKLQMGHDHVLMLDPQGSVWAAGKNDEGCIGTGKANSEAVYAALTKIESLPPCTAVFATSKTSFAITVDGKLYGWGRYVPDLVENVKDKSEIDSYYAYVPTLIPLANVVQVAGRDSTLFFLTSDGSVHVFGSENSKGQLCIGKLTQKGVPAITRVDSLSNIVCISHRSAIDTNGICYTWGEGIGFFIDGGKDGHPSPIIVPLPTEAAYTCAGVTWAFVVLKNGSVYCWSETNPYPTLLRMPPVFYCCTNYNNGVFVTNTNQCFMWKDVNLSKDFDFPTLLEGFDGIPIVHVALSSSNTFVVTSNGDVYTAGKSHNGQQADGLGLLRTKLQHNGINLLDCSSFNITVPPIVYDFIPSSELRLEETLEDTTLPRVYCGCSYGIVVTEKEEFFEFEMDLSKPFLPKNITKFFHRLYNKCPRGYTSTNNVPIDPSTVSINRLFVGEGSWHPRVIAPTSNGKVYISYEIGPYSASSGGFYTGYLPSSLTDVYYAHAGYCSFFVKKDCTLWAVGSNSYGELGIGSVISTKIPVRVNLPPCRMVAHHNGVTYAITTNDEVWAWGRNNESSYMQLMVDSTDPFILSPQKTIMSNVKKLVIAPDHMIVMLKKDGTLWAVGSKGPMFNGADKGISGWTVIKPVKIYDGAVQFVDISASRALILCTTADHRVFAFGEPWVFGAFPNLDISTFPVQLPFAQPVLSASCGRNGACFVTPDGILTVFRIANNSKKVSPLEAFTLPSATSSTGESFYKDLSIEEQEKLVSLDNPVENWKSVFVTSDCKSKVVNPDRCLSRLYLTEEQLQSNSKDQCNCKSKSPVVMLEAELQTDEVFIYDTPVPEVAVTPVEVLNASNENISTNEDATKQCICRGKVEEIITKRVEEQLAQRVDQVPSNVTGSFHFPLTFVPNIKRGSMQKQSNGLIKSWQTRFFVLSSADLCYYEDRWSKVTLGVIRLFKNSRVFSPSHQELAAKKIKFSVEFVFCVESLPDDRIYFLVAETASDKIDWMEKISVVISESFR
ncbi:hypothetical protein RCL1_005133 [Eukaryota sp. TZLM3-RCL]